MLIPKKSFMKDEPFTSQILSDPKIKDKPLQLSLLQRSQTPQKVDVVSTENEPAEEETIKTGLNARIIQELGTLKEGQLRKSKIILDKFNESPNIGYDEKQNITIDGNSTSTPIASFLYNLQQPTKKLDVKFYSSVLTRLNVGSHLIPNKYAKEIVENFQQSSRPESNAAKRETTETFETPEKFTAKRWDYFGSGKRDSGKKVPEGGISLRKYSKSSESDEFA